jgi:antitoxin MazE
MLVSRWGNGLGVRLPRTLVDDLCLKPGDNLEVVSAKPNRIVLARDDRRVQAVDRMRAHAWSAPEGLAFDRDDANAR